ncbi:potassium-transporting ATPase subunit F [Tumidithrix elongata RA019]|uniref:Potassium-transporting ATPase subunit F n=1 Tax=Tumidithrix elongata BACA0141 TaxID=2716417 RepID=A0AAW9Q0L1_9CYAN|nr:potassium-transporting ATPase subunit F [Tumidithrix elongata RA019]
MNSNQVFAQVKQQWQKRRVPLKLFLFMCANLAVAPAIYANNEGISQGQAYAIGLLILTTFVLSVYLFVVMFVPEKF